MCPQLVLLTKNVSHTKFVAMSSQMLIKFNYQFWSYSAHNCLSKQAALKTTHSLYFDSNCFKIWSLNCTKFQIWSKVNNKLNRYNDIMLPIELLTIMTSDCGIFLFGEFNYSREKVLIIYFHVLLLLHGWCLPLLALNVIKM